MKRQSHTTEGPKRLERLFMRTLQDTATDGAVDSRAARVAAIEADPGLRALEELAEFVARSPNAKWDDAARVALRKWRTGK